MATDFDILAQNFTQYVVTPLNAFGLGGFVFDVEGDTSHNLNSEISDHYLEDNSAVQDHWAIRPKRITLKRYVGELTYQQDETIVTQAQQVVRKLTILNSYLPVLSQGAQQIKDLKNISFDTLKESVASQTINKITDYWAFVKNLAGLTSKQQQAYQYLKALQEGKILVSVQTPFEFLNNMAIESITAIQQEGSKYVADFSITLKQIRFAQLITVPAGDARLVGGDYTNATGTENGPSLDATSNLQTVPPLQQGKTAIQNESLQNNGIVPGTKADFEKTFGPLKEGVLLPPPVL